ncbi:hypothetical protein KR009_009119, partial [Drosophila setifemur]
VTGPSRRRASDVFYGDPFKIQSYNFRYADKPVYPVQHYQRAPIVTTPPAGRITFETVYYNPNFNRDPEYPPVNRGPPISSFSECRRRRFLQDFKSVPTQLAKISAPLQKKSVTVAPQTRRPPTLPTSPTLTDYPLLRTRLHREEYQTMRRGQSTTTLRSCNSNDQRAMGGASARCASSTTLPRSSNSQLQPKSTRSGCEININICGLDTESDVDNNVSIKIDTDACLQNNTDKVRAKQARSSSGSDSSRKTGQSFGIDKRLSKFNVSETRPRTCPDWELRQKEREMEAARERGRERERQLQKEMQLERERELQEERELMRRREKEREELRQLERQREREHLLEMEAERERQRLRELERQKQRQGEYARLAAIQEELNRQRRLEPMRVMSTPLTPPRQPPSVPMTSHLYAPTSNDRLPGMMAFCDRPSRRAQSVVREVKKLPVRSSSRSPISRSPSPAATSVATFPRSSRSPTPTGCSNAGARSPTPPPNARRSPTPTQSSKRSATPVRNITPNRCSSSTSPRNLGRVSSGTSNSNVHVTVETNRIMTNSRPIEPKQLNSNPAIVTRLNNLPIRITTSRPSDRDVEFTINRVRDATHVPETVFRRRSCSKPARQDACQVNINVYADTLRRMRM